jgi:hypothetical protein
MPMSKVSQTWETLYQDIRAILEQARSQTFRAVNFAMVQAYWNIGRVIVEEEQKGQKRADYGTALIADLSTRLTLEYGRGFDQRNLWYMKNFYSQFPILNAVRAELTWTHYRLIPCKTVALISYIRAIQSVGIPSWEGPGVGACSGMGWAVYLAGLGHGTSHKGTGLCVQ